MKKIFLLILFNLSLFASCQYQLEIDFNFEKRQIDVKAEVESSKAINLNFEGFNLDQKVNKKLVNKSERIAFEYTHNIKGLNEQFIYLLGEWYPRLNQYCEYKIKAKLDPSYQQVFEKTNKAISSINFIASKEFVVSEDQYKDITLKTYFLRHDETLVKTYFKKIKEYLKLYEEMIAPYPFESFSVVENKFQTGYAMPTYTLIGSRLLDKPYILNQSLGHELLHQYFGSSVFNDFSKGNWIEGLTTYLADDYYRKLLNEDSLERKNILNQTSIFVTDEKEFPIEQFKYRYDKNSSLIGYSKLSFVFHMLENRIGEEQFNALIKEFYQTYLFKEANMNELVMFIQANTKEDLSTFLNQWLFEKGKISFKIMNQTIEKRSGQYFVSFDLHQNNNKAYEFYLPISYVINKEEITKHIFIHSKKHKIMFPVEGKILNITLDKNYDLYRELSEAEYTLTLARLMEEKNLKIVVKKEHEEKYGHIIKSFKNSEVIYEKEARLDALKDENLLLLALDNKMLKILQRKVELKKENSQLFIEKNPFNHKKFIAVMHAGEYKQRYLSMLKYYAQYSHVTLTQKESIKTKQKTQNGEIIDLINEKF